jgi:RNA polymerase sigma-70 factor (ECF subfamily)
VHFAYCEGVGSSPTQSVEGRAGEGLAVTPGALDGSLVEELWQESDGASFGLELVEFGEILQRAGAAQNFGLAEGANVSRQQQAAYLRGLRLNELMLAQACSAGKDRAWERFVATYRQPLMRAAIAITGSETLGRDLADQLYADLYGLTEKDGERRCPLASYRGRGSLMGWLRTTLAQRHVDHHRRSHREEPLEEYDAPSREQAQEKPAAMFASLEKAVEVALQCAEAEDRLLLAAYFLDKRTLLEIAKVLKVHEATVSRKLKRICQDLRKQILKNLQGFGLSRRAAEEALGADPRDLEVNLKKLLQYSQSDAFQEKGAS